MKYLTLVFLILLSMSKAAEVPKPYVVSIVPQTQTTHIQKTWGAFLKELGEQTGFEFELKHYASIPLFEKGLEKGEPDIAFMNPYHAVMAHEWNGYQPIVHDKKPLVGILVVKKDGAIKKISDLDGKTLAFPAPNAFGASLYMRALLAEEEKIRFTPIYLKTHANVYRNVLFENYPAGGGVNNTLMREAPSVSSQLTILYATKPSAPHPLCVHPRVGDKSALLIKNAILNMASNPKYKKLLHDIQLPNPVAADYNKEYLKLQKLNLEKYIVSDD